MNHSWREGLQKPFQTEVEAAEVAQHIDEFVRTHAPAGYVESEVREEQTELAGIEEDQAHADG